MLNHTRTPLCHYKNDDTKNQLTSIVQTNHSISTVIHEYSYAVASNFT